MKKRTTATLKWSFTDEQKYDQFQDLVTRTLFNFKEHCLAYGVFFEEVWVDQNGEVVFEDDNDSYQD